MKSLATRLQVIWVIGISMVILSGLIQLYPSRIIAGLGVAMILGHDLFDGPHAAWLGEAAGAWGIIHQVQVFTLWRRHTCVTLSADSLDWRDDGRLRFWRGVGF